MIYLDVLHFVGSYHSEVIVAAVIDWTVGNLLLFEVFLHSSLVKYKSEQFPVSVVSIHNGTHWSFFAIFWIPIPSVNHIIINSISRICIAQFFVVVVYWHASISASVKQKPLKTTPPMGGPPPSAVFEGVGLFLCFWVVFDCVCVVFGHFHLLRLLSIFINRSRQFR